MRKKEISCSLTLEIVKMFVREESGERATEWNEEGFSDDAKLGRESDEKGRKEEEQEDEGERR